MTVFTVPGSGIAAQLAFLSEATWGVCPSSTFAAGRPLEFKSESLALKKTTVQGQGLHAGGLFDRLSRRVLTNYDAGGAITCDLPNRNLLYILQNMTGSPNTAVTGASTLYEPAQIASSGAYKSYHSPGQLQGISMSWQKGVPTITAGTVEPFTYVGSKVTDWEISVETGAIAQLSLTLDSRNELGGTGNSDPLNTAVPTLGTFTETGVNTATDPLSVFHFREATVYSGGSPALGSGILTLSGSSALGYVKTCSMKETHALDTSRYFLGNNGFKSEQIENGFRSLTGAMTVEFLSSESLYEAFSADTTTTLQLAFVGGVAGTSGANDDTLIITFPNIKLDGESPMVGGPAVVTQSVTFTALDDQSTAPYQIEYISSDSAP